MELGDIGPDDWLVSRSDDCILSNKRRHNVLKAAARCAEQLAARYARETQERQANITLDHSWKQQHFERLAKKLRARSGRLPLTSGRIRGDRRPPRFWLGMHDNPPVKAPVGYANRASDDDV